MAASVGPAHLVLEAYRLLLMVLHVALVVPRLAAREGLDSLVAPRALLVLSCCHSDLPSCERRDAHCGSILALNVC